MDRRNFLKAGLTAAGFATVPFLSTLGGHHRAKPLSDSGQAAGGELITLTLSGPPLQRGRVHGETLREKICELITLWKDSLSETYKMRPDDYISEFLGSTDFGAAITKWTPALMEEVRGIAEGANIDLQTLFAFQCVDEEWWYGRNRLYGISLPPPDKCSTVGVFNQKDIPPILAQNMDVPGYYDGFQTLLRVRDQESDMESLVLSCPGVIALNGLNSKAIGVCVNTLLQLDQRIDGLPVAFVIRGILSHDGFEKALEFVKSVPHASGQCYTIGGSDEVACFECSAHEAVRFYPCAGATRLFHTNHPLVNDDTNIYREFLKKLPPGGGREGPSNAEIRYQCLESRLGDPEKAITIDSVKEALGSKDDPLNPVCRDRRPGGGGFTYACTIIELSKSPVLHIASGPPCSTGFTKFGF
jgi:isopenicillin-N N-acyltransferase-like protein